MKQFNKPPGEIVVGRAAASAVIGLRVMKMAAGGVAAEREAHRMVSEKVAAGLALQTFAMTAGPGLTPHDAAAKPVAHYRRKVRAHRRRLMKT